VPKCRGTPALPRRRTAARFRKADALLREGQSPQRPTALPGTLVATFRERGPWRPDNIETTMDSLTLFGLFAVTLMLVTYALEAKSHWYILAFAGACALGSAYGFLQGAWPFGLVEAIWSMVALRRWLQAKGA
jgi:hypothetical protein